MKPTSSLSLLLFIRLVSATPIPIILPDCKTSACTSFISNPNTPPTRLNDPHFPSHQITSSEVFDNTPVTPSSKLPANKALEAAFPLSSAFLESLSNPATEPPQHDSIAIKGSETGDLPAKPTNALPELREEDARLYWASRGGAEEEETASNMEGLQAKHMCEYTRYLQVHRTKSTKNYGDFMVVGIVLLFLAVVVALEAIEKINGLRNLFVSLSSRRGEIYLEGDDFAPRKASFSQPTSTLQHIHVTSVPPTGDYNWNEKV